MDLSINDQELQEKTREDSKERLIFKGENGALYEIIPYDAGTGDDGLSEQ